MLGCLFVIIFSSSVSNLLRTRLRFRAILIIYVLCLHFYVFFGCML